MDVSRYRHNYEGLYEKYTNQKSVNGRENDYNLRFSCKPFENSLISSLSHVDIARG